MAKDLYNKVYYDENKERLKAKRRERYQRDREAEIEAEFKTRIEEVRREESAPLFLAREVEEPQRMEAVGFWRGVRNALASIDGESTAKSTPRVILFLSVGASVFYLFLLQSKELYQSAGFDQPGLVALGGFLMIALFAAFHSISKSLIALALCLYAFGYETYFVVAGTLNDEAVVAERKVEESDDYIFQKEKVERARGKYLAAKARYEDPSSKVFENGWFQKKYVTPAWGEFEKAQKTIRWCM